MNVSEFDHIEIPDSKITAYLLNQNHVDGGTKANFFVSHGFAINDHASFIKMLLKHLNDNNIAKTKDTMFGTKLIIEGRVKTLAQSEFLLRSVWIKSQNQNVLKFVTAYPIEK